MNRPLLAAPIATFVLIVALAAAEAAFAHSQLRSSSPFADAILERAPSEVVLRFSEGVESSLAQVRVFDSASRRVDSGSTTVPRERELVTSLVERLPTGTYTVVWLGLSEDGHSVDGGFVFHVGLPGGRIAAAAEALIAGEAPESVSIPFAVVRFLNLALVLLCVGGTAALALVLYDADERVQRGVRRKLALIAGTLTVVAVAGIILQGAVVTRVGLIDALNWSTASSVLETRFGKVWGVRAVLAAALGLVALSLSVTGRRRWLTTDVMFALAVFLSLTPSSSGHASVRGPVPYLADVAHVQAASAWAGGLAFIALAIASSQSRWPLAARVLPRFSALALAAVVILGLAAVVSAYHQIGSLAAFRDTDYGRLVLLKTALATPLLLLGYVNWRHAKGIRTGVDSPRDRRRFLGIVVVELALVACILAATAILVDEPPPSASPVQVRLA